MTKLNKICFVLIVALNIFPSIGFCAGDDLLDTARKYQGIHKYSTLFTAQDVRNYLSNEGGIKNAIEWCKKTGVLKVYIESFRDGYQSERSVLINARDRFKKEGFEVSGCVTTTKVGKSSTGWKDTISCYTDLPTQERLKSIFEYTAGMFDEIMIDDFWFTDCTCVDCDNARKSKTVKIGNKQFPVSGDSWENYRCELMLDLSKEYVLKASKKINPVCKIIIKYPQWYDRFHERGYDVIRETEAFDKIWVGTETRDYEDKRWGGTVQYEAFFIMRWLGEIGGKKCGGGWFDWLGTTENTYIEQARQTILGGAVESFLFCYGGLQRDTGPKNIEALRQNIPELLQVAQEVKKRKIIGIAAYKPANSHPEEEARVFDFVGMMGLPMVPTHKFPTSFPVAFFSVHSLKDNEFLKYLKAYIGKGNIAFITDGLAKRIEDKINLNSSKIIVLKVSGNPKSLLQLSQTELDEFRDKLLGPYKIKFKAPNKVGLYLFSDKSYVIENFKDQSVEVEYNGKKITIQPRNWIYEWK